MKNILMQLYDGEIFPAQQYRPKTEQYISMCREHCRHYDDFIQQLKELEPPLHKQFIKIMDEHLDEAPLEIYSMFIDGFKLGARMIIEIYQDNTSDNKI